ncbi:MAG: hypothetical protein ABR575_01530, partial [Actinomycetota bacterium]
MTRLRKLALLAATGVLSVLVAGSAPAVPPSDEVVLRSPSARRVDCTAAARRAMPEGKGHDHFKSSQHRFSCAMDFVRFLPLHEELAARPDVVLGEMDVK